MRKTKRNIALAGGVISAAVCVMIAALIISLGKDVREEVSVAKSGAAMDAIRKKFMELAAPVQRDLALVGQWGRAGLMDLDDAGRLKAKLIPLLGSLPVVNSLILADTDGREFFLLKEGSSWLVRRADSYREGMDVRIHLLDQNSTVVKTMQAARGFDPRTRAWFAGALQTETPDAIYWSEPYRFKTVGKLGITASIRWESNAKDGILMVAAMDILLDTLHQFMAGLQVTPGAQIVLLRKDGTVMPSKFADAKADPHDVIFYESADLPDGPVKDALAEWTDLQDRTSAILPFTSREKKWWASFQPLQAESRQAWIGVLIPEADLVGNIRKQWGSHLLAITILLITGAVAMGLLIRQYVKNHGPESGHAGAGPEDIRSLIPRGENNRVEFKSTLRTNLKSGKKDKAIELAWLKSVTAFMNSEGGTLLVGVDDSGTVRGLEEDGFENDDKCLLHVKNLIHEHIGSEFAGGIEPRLHVIDEKIVVSLTCRKSDQPVFLRIGQNEDFFIRSGPSTTKLSMSKMVAYLDQRKKGS